MAFRTQLECVGHKVIHTECLESTCYVLNLNKEKNSISIAFVDLDLRERMEGLKVLQLLKEQGIYSVILSSHDKNEIIEQALEIGANDYLLKPFRLNVVSEVIDKFSQNGAREKAFDAKIQTKIKTQNYTYKKVLQDLRDNALYSSQPILLLGPSGVGKTILAKAVHTAIHHSDKNFIEFNSSELSEKLAESELFGHEKGAFTGATSTKIGLLELANGGTLFLDEIGTMPLNIQQKLLKAIEEQAFYRVGDKKRKIKSNFRLISATCENLREKITEGRFREDFYYRISGMQANIPGLKDRPEDIPLLIEEIMRDSGRAIIRPENVMKALQTYPWPGNIRELKKFIEKRIATGEKTLKLENVHLATFKESVNDSNSFLTYQQIQHIKECGLPSLIKSIELNAYKVFHDSLHLNKRKKSTVDVINTLKIGNNRYYRIAKRVEKSNAG